HQGYWEDIGTIESFYEANIALTHKSPPFNLYSETSPIMTHRSFLPGARIANSTIKDAIICEGSVIEADTISGSILGQRSVVKQGTIITDSYLMGNDFYESPIKDAATKHPVIEENCIIKKAIIDKNVHIGKGVQLVNKSG